MTKEKTIYIKNMVCGRCIKVVKEELEKLNYEVETVELGTAVFRSKDKKINLNEIERVLNENGFELIDDRNANIIEKVKILIIKIIHHSNYDDLSKIDFHNEIVKATNLSYQYVSSLFSSKEGITIEKFIIHQKIEKVKELIVYGEMTLSEIAYKLGYSSVQHLSSQFKKITGLTPSYFKTLKEKKRKPIDRVV